MTCATSKKDRSYKVEVLNEGESVTLKPSLTLEDATYWQERIWRLGEIACTRATRWAERGDNANL